jgi:hypothetical protein
MQVYPLGAQFVLAFVLRTLEVGNGGREPKFF